MSATCPPAAPKASGDLYARAHADLLAKVAAAHPRISYDRQVSSSKARADFAAGLAALDDLDWAPPSGSRATEAPHPTGGYHQRIVVVMGHSATVRHLDAAGDLHRGDGPAEVITYSDGAVARASWYRYDQRHNEAGPSVIFSRHHLPPHFHTGGVELCQPTATTPRAAAVARRACLVVWAAHRAAGASAREATRWLAVGAAIGDHGAAEHLRAQGGDAQACAAAAAAGVNDALTMAEVGHGRLPLSWAIAGLPSRP